MEDNSTIPPDVQKLDDVTASLFHVLMVPACLALIANVSLLVISVVKRSARIRSTLPLIRCLALADGLCSFSYIFGYTMTSVVLPMESIVSTFIAIAVLHGIARMAHSWSIFALVLDRYLSLLNSGKYRSVFQTSRKLILCVAIWVPCGGMGILTGESFKHKIPISVSIFRDILRAVPMLIIPIFYVSSHIILKRQTANTSRAGFTPLDGQMWFKNVVKTRNIILYFSVIAWAEGLCLVGAIALYSFDFDDCDTSGPCSYKMELYYFINESVSLIILVLATLLDPIVIILINKNEWFHEKQDQTKKNYNGGQETESLVPIGSALP